MDNSNVNDLINSLDDIRLESQTINFDDAPSSDEEAVFSSGKDYRKKTIDQLKADRYHNNTGLRTILARWALSIVTAWLGIVAIILMYNNDEFCLSESVLITLLTTTTANVLGLIYIVMKDIFHGKSED